MNIRNAFAKPPREFLRLMTRQYPFFSGCGTIACNKILASLMLHSQSPIVTSMKGGEQIQILANDYVGRAVYYFGDLDPKITWICRRILRPGDTAIDIGANVGVVAIRMAAAVGPNGAVHAFEPQPNLASMLAHSAQLNRFSHLHVHPIALGAEDGRLPLSVPSMNAGAASLIRRRDSAAIIEVPVRRSGEYLRQLNPGPIRLVKIDVEGFEASVISGAMDYIRENPPDAVLIETNDFSTSFVDQPSIKLLLSLNYSFAEIPRVLVRMRVRRIDLSAPRSRYSHDVLAVQDGPNARDILLRVATT